MDVQPCVPAGRGGTPGQGPYAVRGHVDLLHWRLFPGMDRDHHSRPVTREMGRPRRLPRNLSAPAGWLIVKTRATMSRLSPCGRFDVDVNMQPSGPSHGFWDLLTHEERRVLLSLGRERDYSPGMALCVEGEPATHVFILLDGWVK